MANRAHAMAVVLLGTLLGCRGSSASPSAEPRKQTGKAPAKPPRTTCPDVVLTSDPPALTWPAAVEPVQARGQTVVARWYESRIFAEPSQSSTVIGYARRGSTLAIRRAASGVDCPADMWVELLDGGFACAARDFRVEGTEVPHPVEAKLDEALPFGYAKVVHEGAPRLRHLPSAAEWAQLTEARAKTKPLPNVVRDTMDGAFFITVAQTLEHDGRQFVRTDAGDYVAMDDVEIIEPPATVGVMLGDDHPLPVAFVREASSVRCRCDGGWQTCGQVDPPVALAQVTVVEHGDEALVETADGYRLDRAAVRLATTTERPAEVSGKWVHVDLAEQTLVAYEDDEPVYATVVASGKSPKHATKPGVFRVYAKYVTTTMAGPDEDKGSYTVSDVPWTMYYDGDFALHGAYWHDAFGAERSHGCVNLPPHDARWLFGWSGALPSGWHSSGRPDELWVVITGD